MATEKWASPESAGTALSTEFNSLADGSFTNASSAIDNETDLYLFMQLELVLASLTPTGQPRVDVYLITSLDGTNYADGGGSTAPPAHTLIFSFDLSTSTGAKRRVSQQAIEIPPLKFKLVARNGSGVSLASSGNTLKYRRHNLQA